MSLDGLSSWTETVHSSAFQNRMQSTPMRGAPLSSSDIRKRHEIQETIVGKTIPMLDLNEFAALDSFDSEVSMCSPAEAFKLRASGRLSVGGDLPTLHSYLAHPSFMAGEVHPSLRTNASKLPQPNTTIAVHSIAGEDEKAQYGVVMPGSFVALSKSLARLMANAGANSRIQMNLTSVYPDEMMYQGAPYGFVYVPRSLLIAFERYQADLGRLQNKGKNRIRRVVHLLDTKVPQQPHAAMRRG